MQCDSEIVVNAPRPEVYQFWKDPANLDAAGGSSLRIQSVSKSRTHWTIETPMGATDWEAEVTQDVPNESIGWVSVPGSGTKNSGRVTFRDAPGGATRVDLTVDFEVPGGEVGSILGKVAGVDPEGQVRHALERVKSAIEGQSSARRQG